MKKAETFIPYVLEPGYGVVMVEVTPCAKCAKQTLVIENAWRTPGYFRASRAEQMKRAGWVDRSSVTDAQGGTLCVECAPEAGAFVCVLCKQSRTGEPKESYGDPPERLCVTCFETVTAKVWVETCEALHEDHRYDFE